MRRTRNGIFPIVILLLVFPAFGGDEPDIGELVSQASEAYDAGRYEVCGQLFEQAIEHGARFETVPYNAACCHALAGNVERAFELLDLSLERGWRDVSHLEADTDLAKLRADERWKTILQKATAARAAYAKTMNEELEARLKRVKEIVEADEVKTADDFYHAAMVLQHGRDPEDYKLAHELSLKAAELDPEHSSARWLAAAAKDRYLQNIGKPQIYGTQFRKVDGTWTLDPIDETAVTDEERAKWGVPPLAKAKERAEAMNARD
jgi:tetratricopeptide (TPR) repeat protein